MALAAGTILYIVGELLHLGRVLKGEAIVEIGLLIGFFVAMVTDFAVSSAMELTAVHGPRHGGYFGDANDIYHYELVQESNAQLTLYVNDHLNRPLDTRVLHGRWILDPDAPKPLTGFFTPSASGISLRSVLPELSAKKPIHLKVEVLKGSDWIEMEFFLPPRES